MKRREDEKEDKMYFEKITFSPNSFYSTHASSEININLKQGQGPVVISDFTFSVQCQSG